MFNLEKGRHQGTHIAKTNPPHNFLLFDLSEKIIFRDKIPQGIPLMSTKQNLPEAVADQA